MREEYSHTLGRRVADELERAFPLDERRLVVQRSGFLERVDTASPPRRAWAAAVAVGLAAVLAGYVALRDDGARRPAAAAFDRADRLVHSGGTVVIDGRTVFDLDDDAVGKVVQAGEDAVAFSLERGTVRCTVQGDGRLWSVVAGPYRVRVTGTVFAVSWDPASRALSVTVTRGSVLVIGGALQSGGMVLAAGDRLEVAGRRVTVTQVQPQLDTSGGTAEPVPQEQAGGETPTQIPGADRSAHHRPAWRALLDAGRYAQALAALVRSGRLDRVADTLDAASLWHLGRQARLEGDASAALHLFGALCRRYPASRWTPDARFLMGVIQSEVRGDVGAAQRTFREFLTRHPGHPLAREATGRLMELYLRAGDGGAARRYARAYLQRYPDGPHVDLARDLLRR